MEEEEGGFMGRGGGKNELRYEVLWEACDPAEGRDGCKEDTEPALVLLLFALQDDCCWC